MPNRIIKESIKRSHQIDALTWFEEVVYERLLVTVDDYGCYDGRIVVLRNELFPTKEDVTKEQLSEALCHLEEQGLIFGYESNGNPYIYLDGWSKDQRIRNKRPKFPLPPVSDYVEIDWQKSVNCPLNPIQTDPKNTN